MQIHHVSPTLKLIDLQLPILGYQRFIVTYLFCGERTALIDVGPKAAIPNLLSSLSHLNISAKKVDHILLTHIHIDHAGGVGTAIRDMTRAKVLAHSLARRYLIEPERLWQASLKTLGDLALQYGRIEPVPEERIAVATDLMSIDLGGGLNLEVHLTPGHAPHHMSFFEQTNGVLVAGEAAGVCINGTIRLATPPPFKLDETLSSIDRLISLEPRTLCYGHFGCYDNAVERLQIARSKLLSWHEIVGAAAKKGDSAEEILALLRLKDSSLDYLDSLDEPTYKREHYFLLNSISGLSQASRGAG